MKLRYLLRLLVLPIPLVIGLLAIDGTAETPEQAEAQAAVLTFSVKLEDKLFINNIPQNACGAAAVLGAGANRVRVAAFNAFCRATSLGENPPNPNIVNPLDARIRGGADLTWQCQVGNPNPVNIGFINALGTAGGHEGPVALNIKGTVNRTALRNNILANGSYGYVVSGFPNPIVEPGFQIHRARNNKNIWDKVTGIITCGVDARGLPTSQISIKLQYTAFPSHKLWFRTPKTAANPALLFNVPQGSFSNLWFLPAVPAP